MKRLLRSVLILSELMNTFAGITLTFMMLITVAEVILRYLGRPITGAYELVTFSAAVTIGFSLPFTSWTRGHIYMDFLILKLPKQRMNFIIVLTRLLTLFLFTGTGIFLFKKGIYLHKSGEVSITLKVPFYPIAYGIGICCFCLSLVMFSDIIKIMRGEYE